MSRHEFTRTTKLAAWERSGGCCEECGRKLFPGDRREYDHRVPDGLRKDNSLENCQVLCGPCHAAKTPQDVRQIAKAKRVAAKHNGAYRPKKRIPYRRFDGTPVWPERDE